MEENLKKEVRQDLVCAGPRINLHDIYHVILSRAEVLGVAAIRTPLATAVQARHDREQDRLYPPSSPNVDDLL